MQGTCQHQDGRRSTRLAVLLGSAMAVLWVWAHSGALLGYSITAAWRDLGAERPAAVDVGAPDVFSAPATLAGHVRKAGVLDVRQWTARYALLRHSKYYAYLDKQAPLHPFGMPPATSLPAPPPNIFPRCQVFVNHDYRIIYLRHAKGGSSSILNWFGSGSPAKLRLFNDSLPQDDLDRLWREYFVFSSARNPYARAVSQYKFLLRKMPARRECAELASWDRFCAFPPAMGLACRRRPECCVHKEGFAYIHLNSQTGCMTTASGELAVDYVIPVGRMDQERQALFAEINRRRPAGAPELPVPADAKRLEVTAASGCGGAWRESETYEWEGRSYVTLAPQEQYCTTSEYFGPAHPRCKAQLDAFMAADLALLMGGGGGSASEGGGTASSGGGR